MSAVIAILLLFVALITPNLLSQRRSRQVTGFFVALPDLAVYAREHAQSKRITTRLKYDESRSSFTVETTPDEADPKDTDVIRELPLVEGLRVTSLRAEEETVPSGDWEIIFYPDGRSNGGAVEIDDEGRLRSVLVNDDGAIRLEQGGLPATQERKWAAGEREQRA